MGYGDKRREEKVKFFPCLEALSQKKRGNGLVEIFSLQKRKETERNQI